MLALGWRDDYQAAVDAALTYLQRYATMAELVTASFALDALCRAPSRRILNSNDVEDAADGALAGTASDRFSVPLLCAPRTAPRCRPIYSLPHDVGTASDSATRTRSARLRPRPEYCSTYVMPPACQESRPTSTVSDHAPASDAPWA